jgi:hypothetical protein
MATELDPASRIVLKMRPGLPLGFALYILKPYVWVDGQEYRQRWGTLEVPVEPGEHQVRVLLRYRRAARTPHEVTVTVAPGETASLRYTGPAWELGVGKLVRA